MDRVEDQQDPSSLQPESSSFRSTAVGVGGTDFVMQRNNHIIDNLSEKMVALSVNENHRVKTMTFHLPHFLAPWNDKRIPHRHISCLLWLPSGTVPSSVAANIIDFGNTLRVTLSLGSSMSHPASLMQQFFGVSHLHDPKVVALMQESNRWARDKNSHVIASMTIPLPFPVMPEFFHGLGYPGVMVLAEQRDDAGGPRILHLEMLENTQARSETCQEANA